MSVGQSALGTLLVQRLDAVLGTTMAQHASLLSGARSNAVTQAGPAPSADPTDTSTIRDPRHAVERAQQQLARDPRNAVKDARLETALALAARGRVVASDATASAPTSLGTAARIILALLAQYPEQAPPTQGRQPLWQPPNGQPGTPAGAQASAGSAQASNAQAPGQPAAGATGQGPGQAVAGPAAQAGQAAGAAGPGAALPAPAAAQLARALAGALDGSGMFYESHLAGLAFGKRTAAQLSGEPQARLPMPGPAQAGGAAGPGTPPPAPAPAQGPLSALADAPAETAARSAQGGSGPAGQAALPAGPGASLLPGSHLPPEAALLVRQQLEVLANQVFAWRGEAWPGAPMWWEVSRDEPQAGQDAELPTWATSLALSLPRLGEVQARLSLAGNQLVMHLSAPDSASVLNEYAGQLRERYSAAGFALTHLSVSDQA